MQFIKKCLSLTPAALLVFSRSTLIAGLLPWTIVVLAIAGSLCWSISRKKGTQEYTMTAFLGVAAVLITAAIPVESLEALGSNVPALLIAVVLSFCFFGLWHFEGVKLGTVLCAFVNGAIIGTFTKILEARFEFRDGLKLRKYFEG